MQIDEEKVKNPRLRAKKLGALRWASTPWYLSLTKSL